MDEKYKVIYSNFYRLKFYNINFQNHCLCVLQDFLESNKDINLADIKQYTKYVRAIFDNKEYSIKEGDSYNAYEIVFSKNEIDYSLFCSAKVILLKKKKSSKSSKEEEYRTNYLWTRLEADDALKTLPFLTFYINKLA